MVADDKPASTFKYAEQPVYTASNGAPIPHPEEFQRVGQNGPLLLQDFHLIDLLAHFDRERIPERVVHAKGAGAYGGMGSERNRLLIYADQQGRFRGHARYQRYHPG
jgi:catalase